MSNVVVIGGGPAGVIAACTASINGNSVTVFERNSKICRKLMITGKGRCNVTNSTPDPKDFIENVPRNGRFLFSALANFSSDDTIKLFEGLGVPLKVERGNRVFPESDKSTDIVDALRKYMKQNNVKFRKDRVRGVKTDETGSVCGIILSNDEIFSCDKVILATGGVSYSATGSTGDGYLMAKELGHTVTEFVPSLVPIESSDPCCQKMQGLSLKNVEIKVVDNKSGKTVYKDFGEMLFTHFGVSGPTILSASSHIRTLKKDQYTLFIDLKPALSLEVLDVRVQKDFLAQQNKDFRNSLSNLLPEKMIPVIVERTGIDPIKKVNQLSKSERQTLIFTLKNFSIPLTVFRPIEEAIVTSGGINVLEIEPQTMESKLISGLYFAGEIIDVDALTGGYNLQIAFSTGYLAGNSV